MDLESRPSTDSTNQINGVENLEEICINDRETNKVNNKFNISEDNNKNILSIASSNKENLEIVSDSDVNNSLIAVDLSLTSDPQIKEFTECKNLPNSEDKFTKSDESTPPKNRSEKLSPEIDRNSLKNTENIVNSEDLRNKISLTLENKKNEKVGKMKEAKKEEKVDLRKDEKEEEEEEEEKHSTEVHFRPQKNEAQKRQKRMSFMMKTKGQLFYKKKGPFSKWKEHFAILDESKLLMNFFKSEEEYEKLARCKLSVDLRFVTEIKPIKPRFLQSSCPFKMQRRAGLSTLKLAAYNEEERAKWITMIENIMEKGKMMSDLYSIAEEKRSSTLPNRIHESVRTSSDSETHTTASAPDNEEQLIRPKKVSASSGFKLDYQQISSVKLKRVNSEVGEPKTPVKDVPVGEEAEEVFDPKEKFGVQLRRVQTEKSPPRDEREQSPEYIEFKEKYNSLSLSRKNKSAKLPLNENSVCSHLVVNMSRGEEGESDVQQDIKTRSPSKEVKISSDSVPLGKDTKDPKDQNRKRSPSPNIPISKAVEAVIKNKSAKEPHENSQHSPKPNLNICHATATVIAYHESSDLNMEETASNINDNTSVEALDIVSSSTVEESNKDNISTSSSVTAVTKPCVVKSSHVTKIDSKTESKEENSETKISTKKDEISTDNLGHDDLKQYEGNTPVEDIVIHSNVKQSEENKESFESISEQSSVTNNNTIEPPIKSEIHLLKDEDETSQESSEHVNVDKIIPTIKETINDTSEHSSTGLPKPEVDVKEELIRDKRECKSPSKSYKGIMTQSQIDSIVFGDGYKPPETDNELTVPEKSNEEVRLSFLSYQSQVSTESDDPLPTFNFLGKGDRSSSDSASIRGSIIVEESKEIKSSSSEASVEQTLVKGSSLKPDINENTDNSKEKETRSSLVLPEFTVYESEEEHRPDEKTYPLDNKEISIDEIDKSVVDLDGSLEKENDALILSCCDEKEFPSSELNHQKDLNEMDKKMKEEEEVETPKEKPLLERKLGNGSNESMEHVQNITVLEISTMPNETESVKSTSGHSSFSSKPDELEEHVSFDEEFCSDSDKSVSNEEVAVIQDNDTEVKSKIQIIIHQSSCSSQTDELISLDNSEKINNEEISVIQDVDTEAKPNIQIIIHQDSCSSQTDELIPLDKSDEINNEYSISNSKDNDNNNKCPSDSHIDSDTKNDKDHNRNQTINSLSEENRETLKEIEYEEAEDYFPTFGTVEYRIKEEERPEVLQENSVRTSGIQGLKDFLKENDTGGCEQEYKSGISRLGHSPAIEKLRKETP